MLWKQAAAVLPMIVALVPSPAHGQTGRFSATMHLGISSVDFGLESAAGLRTPPSVASVGTRNVRLFGLETRGHWNQSTATFLRMDFGSDASRRYTFSRSLSTPPFGEYTSEERLSQRLRAWTIGQSLELPQYGRLRLWAGGAISRRTVFEDQETTDVFSDSGTFVRTRERRRTHTRLLAMGGVRLHMTGRLFLAADASIVALEAQDCSTCVDSGRSPDRLRSPSPGRVSFNGGAGIAF